jgi:hypothetical protein
MNRLLDDPETASQIRNPPLVFLEQVVATRWPRQTSAEL